MICKLAGCLILFFSMVMPVSAGILDSAPVQGDANSETPIEYRRGPEQTYLTYPEWFLVFSPDEYAQYVKQHTPTRFPFVEHVYQFWSSYRSVYQQTQDKYPFNMGYHIMIMVIGISTTVEYGLRAVYENTLGRLSELTQSGGLTQEDRYAAQVAQEYVDFIRVRPWYEFDFASRLKGVWSGTFFFGRDMIRKLERKYALTTEYGIKAAYGWLIGLATGATYETAAETTYIVIDRDAENLQAILPKYKRIATLPSSHILAEIPRYDAFMKYADSLAQAGVNFVEVSGNRGEILISALCGEAGCKLPANTRLLFSQPIPTQYPINRYVFTIAVPALSVTLRELAKSGYRIEHLYDF